jgi:hypothetical protein
MIVTETLARITDSKGFCVGIVLWGDEVVDAAPLRWMKGWSRSRVNAFCVKHGWRARVIYQKRCERV